MLETLLMNRTAIRCFGRLDTYGLVAVGSHSTVTAAGSPFLSEDEPGHQSLSSQKQGSPRGSMPLYGLASLPLIGKLNNECTLDRHLWHADDSAAGATFVNLQKYFDLLKVYGPSYGYTPQPHKCILERNLSSAKSKFERYGMKVVIGSRYLGGFIGSPTLLGEGSEDNG